MPHPSRPSTNRTVTPSGLRALTTVAVFLALGSARISMLTAQTKSRGNPQSSSQKLRNPLNDLLDEAQRAIDKNDFQAAIAPLQKFIADQPTVAYGHFQLGYVYTALKRSEDAQSEYQRAIALDPKMAEAYLNLGLSWIDRHPADAVAPLRKAVELLPAQSRPRFLLGVAQQRSGDLPSAADSLQSAAHLDPHDPEILQHLANLLLDLKKPAGAEPVFRNILELQQNNPHALLGLAQSLDAQQKPGAVDAFRAYLEVQPDDSAVRARIARLLIDQQQYDPALAELDRATAGRAPSLDVLRLRAEIQTAQKKWDDAIATLRGAIALAPNDAHLHGGVGRLLLEKRDYSAAEKELKTAIQLDGREIVYWKDLSSTYYLAGNCPATLAILDHVAKSEAPVAVTWFIRAVCYDKLNQPKLALQAYEKFLDMDQGQNPNQVWQAQQRSKVLRRMLEKR